MQSPLSIFFLSFNLHCQYYFCHSVSVINLFFCHSISVVSLLSHIYLFYFTNILSEIQSLVSHSVIQSPLSVFCLLFTIRFSLLSRVECLLLVFFLTFSLSFQSSISYWISFVSPLYYIQIPLSDFYLT